MTNAKLPDPTTNNDDLTTASEALEDCISEFFQDNLIAKQSPDACSTAGLFNKPIPSIAGGDRL